MWLADSGGKGIQIIPVAHGQAQLRSRWRADGAQVISDTCGVKIWLPGITDLATLKDAAGLCGTAAFREHGQDHHTRHDVMTPEMIRQLPPGRALVIRGGMAPVIASLPMGWDHPEYRRARRAGAVTADVTPAPPVLAVTAGQARSEPKLRPAAAISRGGLRAVPEPEADATPDLPWS